MARDEPHQMRIRIPKELHDELEMEAEKKSISINAEVIARLRAASGGDWQPVKGAHVSLTEIRSILMEMRVLTAAVNWILVSDRIIDDMLPSGFKEDMKAVCTDADMTIKEISHRLGFSPIQRSLFTFYADDAVGTLDYREDDT